MTLEHKFVAFAANAYGVGYTKAEAINHCRKHAPTPGSMGAPDEGEPIEALLKKVDKDAAVSGFDGSISWPEDGLEPEEIGKVVLFYNGSQGERGDMVDVLWMASSSLSEYISELRVDIGRDTIPEGAIEDMQLDVEMIEQARKRLYSKSKYSDCLDHGVTHIIW